MAPDLRRTVSEEQLLKQKLRDAQPKPAPGAWAAAAEYARTRPEQRFPVIIDANSLFRKPEDLRDFSHLPSVPPVTQTTETTLVPVASKKGKTAQDKHQMESEEQETTFQISDVNIEQIWDLMQRTEGDRICVWFRGERRMAWLARSVKKE